MTYLHRLHPAIPLAAIGRELERERRQRRQFYPNRVKSGNMLPAEAERQLALVDAWLEDCTRIQACWFDTRGSLPWAPRHGFTWQERRAGLLRELELRDRVYPRWIADGRVLEKDAAHRIACLQCLLEVYEDGWDWRGSDGRLPSQSPAAEAEYRQLRADVAQRKGISQKELDL